MKHLWRTEIVIYTPFDPSNLELNELSAEATGGLAYCESQSVTTVNSAEVSDSARTFFNLEDDGVEG